MPKITSKQIKQVQTFLRNRFGEWHAKLYFKHQNKTTIKKLIRGQLRDKKNIVTKTGKIRKAYIRDVSLHTRNALREMYIQDTGRITRKLAIYRVAKAQFRRKNLRRIKALKGGSASYPLLSQEHKAKYKKIIKVVKDEK